MTTLRVVSVLLLTSILCMAGDLARTFQEAAALADAQEREAATKDYFSKVPLPYYGQKYAPVLQSCFATVQQPDSNSFSLVAAIGSDGRVLRIYDDRETNISKCLREAVQRDVFPVPPAFPDLSATIRGGAPSAEAA